MIEAVVFDCDGTLLDSMPAWHAMQERLAQRAGVVLGEHELDVLNANTLSETAEFFHRECGLGASSQEVLEYARNMLMGEYLTSVLPREGAVSLVKRLHQDDVKLAVASSSPETFLRAGLTRAGIYDLFDVVASAEDEHQSKSTPRFFWSVAGRLGGDAPAHLGHRRLSLCAKGDEGGRLFDCRYIRFRQRRNPCWPAVCLRLVLRWLCRFGLREIFEWRRWA